MGKTKTRRRDRYWRHGTGTWERLELDVYVQNFIYSVNIFWVSIYCARDYCRSNKNKQEWHSSTSTSLQSSRQLQYSVVSAMMDETKQGAPNLRVSFLEKMLIPRLEEWKGISGRVRICVRDWSEQGWGWKHMFHAEGSKPCVKSQKLAWS